MIPTKATTVNSRTNKTAKTATTTTAIHSACSSEDGLRKGTAITPWYSGQNKFATQAGTGGFLKVRDVLPHSKGGKEIDEAQKIKSEGVVPLQAGTNRLASQKGMTGFGTPRNVLQKQGWKREWIEEYETALREFEETRPPGSASATDSSCHFKQRFEEKRGNDTSKSITVQNSGRIAVANSTEFEVKFWNFKKFDNKLPVG
ncbi:unnamed protein product [Gongylonema pulchrum]|uniref:Calponin-homology (CH) domain-containing protein n=1 Tax=Gongylonema pulchrum TaxID=637853 RepID=A0A3P7N8Z7_9BILA|nr:unnamed protein product [Gongylonema pulchrum]